MLVRREAPADATATRAVVCAAFSRAGGPGPEPHQPLEAVLVDDLRGDRAWIPELSFVVTRGGGEVIGHVLCTRGHVGETPALALGPLSVRPDCQRQGVGQALVHTVLGAADALGEPLVALLGDARYYGRFGFRPAADLGIAPPSPEWRPHFHVRVLTAFPASLRGIFSYPEPFGRI